MKYSKPVSKTLEVTPRDTICGGAGVFKCGTWKCSGYWNCDSPNWKGCSKKYSL